MFVSRIECSGGNYSHYFDIVMMNKYGNHYRDKYGFPFDDDLLDISNASSYRITLDEIFGRLRKELKANWAL